MSFSPQKFREIIFQLLFSIDMGNSEEGDVIPFLMRELAVTKKIVRDAHQKSCAVWTKRDEIDQIIARLSEEYALERIGKVERNVLRLGVYELLYVTGLAPEVAIAESIRLASKFSTPEAATYVNAVMDAFHKEVIAKNVSEPKCALLTQDVDSSQIAYGWQDMTVCDEHSPASKPSHFGSEATSE